MISRNILFRGALAALFTVMAIGVGHASIVNLTSADLPYRTVGPDTIRISGTKIVAAGSAIILAHEGAWLDLQDDTVVFGNDGSDGNVGIRLEKQNITISGGYIIHTDPSQHPEWLKMDTTPSLNRMVYKPYDTSVSNQQSDPLHGADYGAKRNRAIYANPYPVSPGKSILFRGVTVIVGGFDATAIHVWSAAVPDGYFIDSCNVYNWSWGGSDRCGFTWGVGMKFNREDATWNFNADDFEAHVTHCNLWTTYTGIGTSYKIRIDSNFFCVDARNNYYPIPSGNFCQASVDAFAVDFYGSFGPNQMIGNTIRSGYMYEGGQGIFLNKTQPADTSFGLSEIAFNDVRTHNGRNSYEFYNGGETYAVFLRLGTSYQNVHDNYFQITVDADTIGWPVKSAVYGTEYIGKTGSAGRFEFHDNDGFWGLTMAARRNHVVNNTFKVVVNSDDGSGSITAKGLSIQQEDGEATFYDNWFRGNTIIGYDTVVQMYTNNGNANNVRMENDLLMYTDNVPLYDGGNGPRVTYHVHAWSGFGNSLNNRILDPRFANGTSDNSVKVDGSGEVNLALRRTVNVYAKGNNGLPVAGANVVVKDNSGATVLSGSTGANGAVSGPVTYRTYSNTGTAQVNFNNFQITVTSPSGTDQASNNAFVVDPSFAGGNDTLLLANTTGSGDWDAPTVLNLNYLTIDSLRSDFSSEQDSIRLSFQTPNIDFPDSIIICWSSGTYPDSASANRRALPFQQNASLNTRVVLSVNETGSAYVSYWVFDSDYGWSTRGQASRAFTAGGGGEVDTVPPATIDDLESACAGSPGSYQLSWTAPGDDGSEGTAARYELRYSTSPVNAGNFNSAAIITTGTPAPAGSGEQVTAALPVSSQSYYFAIRAFDDANNFSNLDENSEAFAWGLSTPVVDTPVVNKTAHTVTLSATTVPSCYATSYVFQMDSLTSFATAIEIVDSNPGSTASAVFADLQVNTVYYWRARVATDGAAAGPWTQTRAFVPFFELGTGCGIPLVISPNDGQQVTSSSVSLVIENIDTAPENIYFFEISADETFADLFDMGVVSQAAGANSQYTIGQPLTAGQTYFWRCKVNDCEYSPTVSFVYLPTTESPKAYPNPFYPAQAESVTFTPILPGKAVTLMSPSGSIIRRWPYVETTTLVWDGTNQSGSPVASGVYLWFVEDSDIQGKIVVIR